MKKKEKNKSVANQWGNGNDILPVGVRNLIKERQKYLFRSLYTKNPARKCGIFTFYLLPLHSYLKWQDFLGSNR